MKERGKVPVKDYYLEKKTLWFSHCWRWKVARGIQRAKIRWAILRCPLTHLYCSMRWEFKKIVLFIFLLFLNIISYLKKSFRNGANIFFPCIIRKDVAN